jgi:hypothetical protein
VTCPDRPPNGSLEAAIARTLASLRPAGEVVVPPMIADMRKHGLADVAKAYERIGESLAVGILAAIAGDPESQPWLRDRAQPIATRLGEAIVQRLALETGINAPTTHP